MMNFILKNFFVNNSKNKKCSTFHGNSRVIKYKRVKIVKRKNTCLSKYFFGLKGLNMIERKISTLRVYNQREFVKSACSGL